MRLVAFVLVFFAVGCTSTLSPARLTGLIKRGVRRGVEAGSGPWLGIVVVVGTQSCAPIL